MGDILSDGRPTEALLWARFVEVGRGVACDRNFWSLVTALPLGGVGRVHYTKSTAKGSGQASERKKQRIEETKNRSKIGKDKNLPRRMGLGEDLTDGSGLPRNDVAAATIMILYI